MADFRCFTELDLWNLALGRIGSLPVATDAELAVTSATATNPVTIATTTTSFHEGELALVSGLVQMTELNGRLFEVSVSGGNLSLHCENGTEYAAETTGGKVRRIKPSKQASAALRHWPHVRDEVFRDHPWNCLIRRTRLARLASPTAITGATAANPVVITSAAHNLQTGDQVLLERLGGMIELSDRFFRVTRLNSGAFSLDGIDGTLFTVYTSGGLAKRVLLPLTPDFGYDHKYPLPGDSLRLLDLVDKDPKDVAEIVGREVFTDEGPLSVPVRYVRRLLDPQTWDAQLVSALAARLAVDFAREINAASAAELQALQQQYSDLLEAAKRSDALENTSTPPSDDEWETARL